MTVNEIKHDSQTNKVYFNFKYYSQIVELKVDKKI